MSRYASDTSVSVERSKAEIEATLARYGATEFASGWRDNQALVGFKIAHRQVRFILPLPDRNAREYTHTPSRDTERRSDEAMRHWEQACRQRWRALLLCIKAKLEAVEADIETFDEAFMPHIVMANGQTVSQWLVPQIGQMYDNQKMPPLLMAGSDAA